MTVIVDLSKLEKIANNALVNKRSGENLRKKEGINERDKQKALIQSEVKKIFTSIPAALEEAANDPKQTPEGNLFIVAEIPIVREHLTSIMDTEGSLSTQDASILKATRNKLKDFTNPNIKSIEISNSTIEASFSDSTDNAYGPCISYFLKVIVILPK